LNEYQFPPSKIASVQGQLERLIEKNYYLNQSAKEGYRSYLLAYASHSLKMIFDVTALDLSKVGAAFGFTVPPTVNLLIGAGGKNVKSNGKKRRIIDEGDHGGFSKQVKKAIKYKSNKQTDSGKQWSR